MLVFTSDGLVISVVPRAMDAGPPLSRTASQVSFGAWVPTGDRTANELHRFRATDGSYIERRVSWEVSADDRTLAGTADIRGVRPDGTTNFEDHLSLEATRLTAGAVAPPAG
jgi:hypothetical protein